MRIILVRHGESQANVDQSIHKRLPDHEIALSTRGQTQAKTAAEKLYEFYVNKYGEGEVEHWQQHKSRKFHFINSPYRRTRDTADIISRNFPASKSLIRKENILLCEQQFGIFDGLEDDEIERKFPEEYKTWKLCKNYNGKFWARYPMGESPFDAAIRVNQAFARIKKNSDKDHIIICHGTVVKLFVMMWFNYSPEWFATCKTIGNCGLYLIEDNKDKGYIFPGYRKGKIDNDLLLP